MKCQKLRFLQWTLKAALKSESVPPVVAKKQSPRKKKENKGRKTTFKSLKRILGLFLAPTISLWNSLLTVQPFKVHKNRCTSDSNAQTFSNRFWSNCASGHDYVCHCHYCQSNGQVLVKQDYFVLDITVCEARLLNRFSLVSFLWWVSRMSYYTTDILV